MALATGQTLRAAAEAAGVSEKTAGRRWGDPNFRRNVLTLRGELLSRARGRAVDAAIEAVEVARQLLKANSDPVKLGAVRTLLENVVRLREHIDLEERLSALEERMKTP